MSSHNSPRNDLDRLDAMMSAGRETNHDDDDPTVRRVAIGRTAFRSLAWATSITGVAAIVGGAPFAWGVLTAPKVSVSQETKAGVADGGKSEIIKLDLDMPPTTIATAETSNEAQPLEVGLAQSVSVNLLDLIKLDIPAGTDSIKRAATATEEVKLDATKVEVSIDPDKGEFIYTVPSASLSADVTIKGGDGKNVDQTDSLFTNLNNALGGTQAKTFDGLMKSLNVDTNTRDLPYVQDLVKQNIDTANALVNYADLKIETGVATQCTPLFKDIPGFTDGIKDNIRTVMRGELLSDSAPQAVKDALGKISAKSVADAQTKLSKMAENAEVILPEDLSITASQDAADKLKQLEQVNAFTATSDEKPMTCGVGKLVTATGGQNNG